MDTSRAGDLFLWMDDKVKLFIRITQEYRVAMVTEKCRLGVVPEQITLWRHTPLVPVSITGGSHRQGKDFPHQRGEFERYVGLILILAKLM